jgi:hypothetical protein
MSVVDDRGEGDRLRRGRQNLGDRLEENGERRTVASSRGAKDAALVGMTWRLRRIFVAGPLCVRPADLEIDCDRRCFGARMNGATVMRRQGECEALQKQQAGDERDNRARRKLPLRP